MYDMRYKVGVMVQCNNYKLTNNLECVRKLFVAVFYKGSKCKCKVEMALAEGRQIDKEPIKKHVEKLLKHLSLDAESLEINSGSSRGENYMGSVAKVRAIAKDIKGNQLKFNWIVKSAFNNKSYRQTSKIETAYEREVQIYRNIFPAFETLQQDIGIQHFFESYPKFYYYNLDNLDEVIILQNMNELGYKTVDRKNLLDFHHVVLVIRQYAKFHALSFVLKDRSPQIFSDLKDKCKGHYYDTYTDEELIGFGESEKKTALECLDSLDKTLMERTVKFIDKFRESIRNATKSDEYSVFTHGDCWINNLLFRYANPQNPDNPTDVCFLDFQISSVASPVLDISYFIMANTDSDFRIKHYDFILEEYYSCLSKSIKKLGSDPEKLYPLDVYSKHLKDYMCFGLYITLIVVKLMVSDDEEAPDFSIATSVEEIIKMFNYEPKNLDLLQKRIRDLVRDGARFGLL